MEEELFCRWKCRFADGPTTESPLCSRPLLLRVPRSDYYLRVQVRDQAAYARTSDIKAMYYGVQVLAPNGPRQPQLAVRSSVHRRLSKSSPIGGQNGAVGPMTQTINV